MQELFKLFDLDIKIMGIGNIFLSEREIARVGERVNDQISAVAKRELTG